MTAKAFRDALTHLALLALVVFAGDRLLAAAAGRVLAQSQFRFALLQRGGQQASVLVLGDSRGVNGFYAPEIERRTGERVFNLSYNGMSARIAEAVLSDYLARNAAPRLLVLEVTNAGTADALLDGLMSYWNGCPALGRLAEAVSPKHRAAARLSHLYAVNGEVPLRALYYLRRSDQDWINRYRIEPALLASVPNEPAFTLAARPENLDALRRMVALARGRGIAVRLIVTPYLPGHIAHATNREEWLARIGGVTGERVWDYSTAIADPGCFADRLHLNDRGAEPFVDRLVSDGFFAMDSAAAR